jgi:aspartate/methionine/tyrosine aminotransferase
MGSGKEVKIAKRAEKITPFYVMELLEKAKALETAGEHVVHMEVGEPDFASPQTVKEGAIRAITENRTFYTHSLGLPELREKIAGHYRKTEGIEVSPERIVITNGTSGAFLLLFAALLDKERMLAVSDPGYPCYRNFGLLMGAPIAFLPVSGDTLFEVTAQQVRDLKKKAAMLVISHPSNPTGIVYREETIRDLFEALSGAGGVLVVDEIYSGLVYGKKVRTSLALSDEIVVINGFSKTFAMTGWRLGWMVLPADLVRPIQKIAQNVFISPPSISQYAALSAFDAKEELEGMRRTYEQRRDFLLPRLKGLGFTIPVDPEGAFYIYAGIERWGIDSMDFAERALKEARVALTPGYDFGNFQAGSHVRFSYATSLEMIEEGCNRLEKWLNGL